MFCSNGEEVQSKSLLTLTVSRLRVHRTIYPFSISSIVSFAMSLIFTRV